MKQISVVVQVVGTSQDYPIIVVVSNFGNSFLIKNRPALCTNRNTVWSLQLHVIEYIPLNIYRSGTRPAPHFRDEINFIDWGRKNVAFPHLGQFGVKRSPLNEINVTSAFRNLQYLQVK